MHCDVQQALTFEEKCYTNVYNKQSDETINIDDGNMINIRTVNFRVGTFFYPLLFLVHTQFIGVNGEENNDDDLCHLDDLFPFILSILYAITSLLTLVGVSYWSFKSMTGKFFCICDA